MKFIVPAILPSSYHELEERLTLLDHIPPRRVQIDIVDGTFATPPTWPYLSGTDLHDKVTNGETLPNLDRVEYEADLMCNDPEGIAVDLLNFGVTRLTVHAECAPNIGELIARMRKNYSAEANFALNLMSIGLAINVSTDSAVLEPLLDELEYVQFMGVDRIGRQGEAFNPAVIEKVRAFRRRHPSTIIQVDGGVSLENGKQLIAAGASRLVVGSALMQASDLIGTFKAFEALQNPYGV